DLELDEYLVDDNKNDEFWIGEPELVDWTTQIGYVFGRISPRMEIHPTLVFDNLKKYMKAHDTQLSCDSLRRLKIHIIKQNETSYDSWSAYNCLYAEVTLNNEVYILRNGVWYSVNKNFVASIDKALEHIDHYDVTLPLYSYDREEDYNK
ncbi:TIGR04141 family sporadically distributed protein, partial [Cronobacter malonaticus]